MSKNLTKKQTLDYLLEHQTIPSNALDALNMDMDSWLWYCQQNKVKQYDIHVEAVNYLKKRLGIE